HAVCAFGICDRQSQSASIFPSSASASAVCHLPPLDIANTRLTPQLLLSLHATLLACDPPTQHSSSRSFPTAKDPSGKPGPKTPRPKPLSNVHLAATKTKSSIQDL
ncbi:hypothetical protein RB213_011538, partial [Colletotrichum asianum]